MTASEMVLAALVVVAFLVSLVAEIVPRWRAAAFQRQVDHYADVTERGLCAGLQAKIWDSNGIAPAVAARLVDSGKALVVSESVRHGVHTVVMVSTKTKEG